jgi:hypothetical protein
MTPRTRRIVAVVLFALGAVGFMGVLWYAHAHGHRPAYHLTKGE